MFKQSLAILLLSATVASAAGGQVDLSNSGERIGVGGNPQLNAEHWDWCHARQAFGKPTISESKWVKSCHDISDGDQWVTISDDSLEKALKSGRIDEDDVVRYKKKTYRWTSASYRTLKFNAIKLKHKYTSVDEDDWDSRDAGERKEIGASTIKIGYSSVGKLATALKVKGRW